MRISIFYCALFLGLGIFLPFFPVWLVARGLSAPEISIVLGAQTVVRILAGPLFAYLSDRTGSRKRVVVGLSLAALAGMVAMSQLNGFAALLLVGTLAAAAWTPIMPLIETLAVSESEAGGADYGRMRLWGSLSFIAGSVGSGYALNHLAAGDVIWLLVGADAVLFAAALSLPRDAEGTGASVHAGALLRLRDVVPVLRRPDFVVFMVAASLIQASHAVYYGFGSIHWQSLGIADDAIGLLWSVGVIAEVSLFLFARRAVAALGPVLLVALGGAGAAVRWSATTLDPSLGPLIVVQALHALTFGATHLGVMHFIARRSPQAMHASVQGAYAAFSGGIVMAGAMAASGPLYAAAGAKAYLAMATIGLVGAVLALLVRFVLNPTGRAEAGA